LISVTPRKKESPHGKAIGYRGDRRGDETPFPLACAAATFLAPENRLTPISRALALRTFGSYRYSRAYWQPGRAD